MAQTHYLWFDASGKIVGISPGHWTDWSGMDPTDDPPADTHGKNVRDSMINDVGAIGGISHACACTPGDTDCPHANEGYADYYVDDPEGTPVLTAKAALTILVDGVSVPVNDGTPIEKTPGASVTLKLQASVPDDTAVTLRREGAVIYPSDPVLTFTAGETNEVTLTAPGQGQVGGLSVCETLVRPVRVNLLGWA